MIDNPEIEVAELDTDVLKVNIGGRIVTIVGTAHISSVSVERVREAITSSGADAVCVELCGSRLDNLNNPDRWKQTDLFQVIKRNQGYLLTVQLIISSFQRRLGNQLGVKPGDEMRKAVELAKQQGLPIFPIDRDIKITMKRAWAGSSMYSILKIIAALGGSMFSREQISEKQLEELKSKDVLSAALSELSEILPSIKEALIDERDEYMAAKILGSSGSNVVAVVGAGHVPGILRHLETGRKDVSDLEIVRNKPSVLIRSLKILAIVGLISALVLLVYLIGVKNTFIAFGTWTIINGLFAALAAALCFAHPLTVLTAFFSSPIAAIHPGFAVGWVCALVEAYLRKPRVQDFEQLIEGNESGLKLMNNRVARILLLLIIPNLGSIIGTLVSIYILSSSVPI